MKTNDPWSIPTTSAGHGDRDVGVADEQERKKNEAQARNLLLIRLLVGFAGFLSLAFALVVGGGAWAHSVDRELFTTWWSHHAEYDCCYATEGKCADGVAALVELRERLHERDGSAREVVAAAVAHAVGLVDLDVSSAPADAAAIDQIFATCPALQRTAAR